MTTFAQKSAAPPGSKLWIWNWTSGGYNSSFCLTREEALAGAHELAKGTTLRIDETTLHEGTYEELDKLDKQYGRLFD